MDNLTISEELSLTDELKEEQNIVVAVGVVTLAAAAINKATDHLLES